MTTRARNLTALAMLALAAGLGVVLTQRVFHAPERGLLAAAPKDSFLVATIDVQKLRATPLADSLFGGKGDARALPGVFALASACGFDPVARIREAVVAIPEGGERGEFGVAASGDIDEDAFVECAKKAIASRGGRPKVESRGAYTLVEDDDTGSADRSPRVAIRKGTLMVGRGEWLKAMMDAEAGAAPSVVANERHQALRTGLAASSPALVVTAVLPKTLRDRLKREMGEELEGVDRSKLEMGGVLAVESAGLALRITGAPGAEQLEAAADLRCESADACAGVKELVERKRLQASKDFGIRLVGLGPILDSLTVTQNGAALALGARADAVELGKSIDRITRMRGDRREKPASPPAPAPSADEVLAPKSDGGDARAKLSPLPDGGTR